MPKKASQEEIDAWRNDPKNKADLQKAAETVANLHKNLDGTMSSETDPEEIRKTDDEYRS